MKIIVCIFAFNRPVHLEKLFNSIIQSQFIEYDFPINLFYDGPRSKSDLAAIESTRNVVVPFKNVNFHYSDRNKGLARSIISGVSKTFYNDGADAIIVLEDDLIVAKDFFKLIKSALDFYALDPAIGSVTGFSYRPINSQHDFYLSKRFMSWGWATWRDRWEDVVWDSSLVFKLMCRLGVSQSGGDDLVEMFDLQRLKKLDSWAIIFAGYHLIHSKYCVYPTYTRVLNKGFDDSGTHCRSTGQIDSDDNFNVPGILTTQEYSFPTVFEYKIWERQLEYYSSKNITLIRKLIRWIMRIYVR